jgi:hypothetical protein
MIAAVEESIVEFDLDVPCSWTRRRASRKDRRRSPSSRCDQREHGQPPVDSRGGPMFTVYRSCRRPISRRSPM